MTMRLLLTRLAIAAALILIPIVSLPSPASAINCAAPANAQEAIQCGASGAAGEDASKEKLSEITNRSNTNLGNTIKRVLNILSVIIAIIAIIMIVIGGARFVVSAGKQESVSAAKNTVLYAIIGLIIVALAQAIVHFVLRETTGAASSTPTTKQPAGGNRGSSGGD